MRTSNKYSKVPQDVGNDPPSPYISRISSDETHFVDVTDKELTHELSALAHFNNYRQSHPYIETLIFELGLYLFKGYLKEKVIDEEIEYEPKIKLLATCIIRLAYSVIDDSQDDKQRMEYYLEIMSEREKHCWIRPFTTTELAQANLFKVALLNYKQSFLGNNEDLTDLVNYLFNTQSPEVRALSAIGYDEKSQGYYFPEFAYDAEGQRIYANSNKYFPDGNVKPFRNYSDTLTNGLEPIDLHEFITLMNTAYGCKGLLALGFYVSSLFSHVVFKHYSFFPFLSLYGSPHAGKSFISKLLNRCLFMDSEGQTMTSSNTAKGELRKINQQSSLVHALLEGRKNSRFDYDNILPLYNRNTLYSRATASKDNSVHNLHFRTALSFVWNHECFTSKAAKERVISLYFSDTDNNDITSEAWDELNSYSPEQLASVGNFLLKNREWFESELIEFIELYATKLKDNGINVSRIAENYAIALGGIARFVQVLEHQDVSVHDLLQYTIERARHKLSMAKTEAHLADQFFESITKFQLNSTNGVAIHHDELVIHLSSVLDCLKKHGINFNKNKLIAELKHHDRFVDVKTTRCFGKPCEAYLFKKEA